MVWITGGGIIYFLLLVTLGIFSIRKGHWVLFLVGLFLPIFWLIGALMPRRGADSWPTRIGVPHSAHAGPTLALQTRRRTGRLPVGHAA